VFSERVQGDKDFSGGKDFPRRREGFKKAYPLSPLGGGWGK